MLSRAYLRLAQVCCFFPQIKRNRRRMCSGDARTQAPVFVLSFEELVKVGAEGMFEKPGTGSLTVGASGAAPEINSRRAAAWHDTRH